MFNIIKMPIVPHMLTSLYTGNKSIHYHLPEAIKVTPKLRIGLRRDINRNTAIILHAHKYLPG